MELKYCSICCLPKEISEFSLRKNGKRHGVCKSCHNDYNKEHYKNNRELYISRATKRTAKRRKEQRELLAKLKSVPCKDCGIPYPPYVMQFDHLSEKNFTISEVIGNFSWSKMEEEISKCDVVCANCHAERTFQRKIPGSKSAADDLVRIQEVRGFESHLPDKLQKGEFMEMNNHDLGMLRWREGDSWIVASRDYDILTQGQTLEEAWNRWLKELALSILLNKKNNIIQPPPENVLTDWVARDEAYSSQSN